MTAWPRGTPRLLLREVAGPAPGPAFVDWAVRALSDGYDTPALRVLAGLDLFAFPSAFEGAAKFREALRELGLPDMDLLSLRRAYVREVAQDILAGAVAPIDAVAEIHAQAVSPFDHPGELRAWCRLWEARDPETGTPLEREALIEAVRATAQAWV